jgi:hypothetical protein
MKGAQPNRMSILPYWDQNVDLDVVNWLPYCLDFNPVSVNGMHSETLKSIAALSLEMDSEFLFLRSMRSGCVGTLFRENLIDPGRDHRLNLGFSMVFGYSRLMEALLHLVSKASLEVKAGVTLCGVWDRDILLDESKVIALVSENPLFEEEKFLDALVEVMSKAGGKKRQASFYAERFGYRRFSIPYETDDVQQLAISQLLHDFEFDETRSIVGPRPEIPLSVTGFPAGF